MNLPPTAIYEPPHAGIQRQFTNWSIAICLSYCLKGIGYQAFCGFLNANTLQADQGCHCKSNTMPLTCMELLVKKMPFHIWQMVLQRRGVDGWYMTLLQQSTMTIWVPLSVLDTPLVPSFVISLSSADSGPSQYTTLCTYLCTYVILEVWELLPLVAA
jgi:hypothetical protein